MIFTSRYSNPELATGRYTVVGVTRGKPKFPLKYQLAGNIIEIAPPGYLFNEYDRDRFTPRYYQHLDGIGLPHLNEILSGYERMGKDVVLCCFEDVRKPNEWCHRLVFAEWWLNKTGEAITELTDPSVCKVREKRCDSKDDPIPPPVAPAAPIPAKMDQLHIGNIRW